MAKPQKEEEKRLNNYLPEGDELKTLQRVYSRFRTMQDIRDRQYAYFNDKKLTDMIDDAQKRFNGYIHPRSGPEDWGAKAIDPLTRNKVIFVLATLASQRVKVNFFKEDGDDAVRTKIIQAMHEHSYIDNSEESQTFYEMLAAVVKGTIVGYEGFRAPKRKIKVIDDYDIDSGQVKYTTKEIRLESKVFSEIVPLEDFYPGDVRQRDVQKMPDNAWRSVVDYDIFKADFAKYPNIKFVLPGGDVKNDTFFKKFVSDSIEPNKVEVIRYFNKDYGECPDEFHIVANGVLLTAPDNPLPWKHKEKGLGFPFWSTIYEPLDEHFFYGKPLPEKLKSNQDVLDALYRMMLDQSMLSMHKPVLTSAVEDIEDELLRPGRKIPVSDVNEWKELDISPPEASQFQMFEIVRRAIEDASASDTATGSSPRIEKTATQIATEQQGALTLLSMFKNFMEWGAESKARLRVENQLQFYPLPIGLNKDGSIKYRKLRVDNVPLILSDRVGSIILCFYPDKKEIGNVQVSEEVRSRFEEKYGKTWDEISVKKINESVEEVKVTAEFLEDFNVGVKAIADSSQKMSPALIKAMELEFVDRVSTRFPDLIKRDKVARDLVETYDKNPDEYIISSPTQQQEALQRAQEVNTAANPGSGGTDQYAGRTSDIVERMTGMGRAPQQTSAGYGQDRGGQRPGPSINELQTA